MAGGIVAKIVSSPLTAASTVQGARLDINIYLQNKTAPDVAFMYPAVIGYGIPAGGRIEVELGGGFKRDPTTTLNATGIILMTSASTRRSSATRSVGRVEVYSPSSLTCLALSG